MDVYYHHFDELDSTNLWLKSQIDQIEHQAIHVVTAKKQSQGHGRRGQGWVSNQGNLHLSFFFPLSQDHPPIHQLAQLLSYAAAQVLLGQGIEIQFKWPNDLLWKEKKLGGAMATSEHKGVIMGLGINVNTPVAADQPTAHLKEIDGKERNEQVLAKEIIHAFLKVLNIPFSTLLPFFNQLLAYKDQQVTFKQDSKLIEGIVKGMDEEGCIILETEKGMQRFYSGDIEKLRKLQ